MSELSESRRVSREKLLAAAADVFLERGYDGARVHDIVRRAGLTTGAIYGNFRDKADLLLAAVDRSLLDVAAALEAARAGGASASERFTLMGRALGTSAGARQRRLLLEAVTAARHDEQVAPRVHAAVARIEASLAGLLVEAQAEGDVDPAADTASVARFALALALGVEALHGAGVPVPEAGAWADVVERFTGGLAGRTAAPRRDERPDDHTVSPPTYQ